MKTSWIIIAVVLICVAALVLYLITRRDQKDKDEVVKFLNETEIEEEPTPKEKEEE